MWATEEMEWLEVGKTKLLITFTAGVDLQIDPLYINGLDWELVDSLFIFVLFEIIFN